MLRLRKRIHDKSPRQISKKILRILQQKKKKGLGQSMESQVRRFRRRIKLNKILKTHHPR